MKTLILKDNIREAAGILQGGGLVAVPTETVYGLAGNGWTRTWWRRSMRSRGGRLSSRCR